MNKTLTKSTDCLRKTRKCKIPVKCSFQCFNVCKSQPFQYSQNIFAHRFYQSTQMNDNIFAICFLIISSRRSYRFYDYSISQYVFLSQSLYKSKVSFISDQFAIFLYLGPFTGYMIIFRNVYAVDFTPLFINNNVTHCGQLTYLHVFLRILTTYVTST